MKWLHFAMVSVLAAFASFAEVTRDTEWQDVPDATKVGAVLDLGVGGGVNTNAVIDIIHETVSGSARSLPKYLHERSFDDSYPDAAAEYYRSRGNGKAEGGCSAVRDGGFLYRNFDYPFDDRAEFVVRMSAGPNRFASIGVAQVGTNLTEQMVTSGKPEYSNIYKWLPGATVDGINENGVVAEINVVDGPPQWRSGVPAALKIHPLAAVRWSLDNGTSAAMVASNLAARIAFPAGWTQNFHYMIADATSTYIVENGTAYQGGSGVSPLVMTNFRLYPTRDTTGAGQERYDLLLSSACITNAWYTNAYRRETNPPWFSEFGNNYEYLNAALNRWNDGRSKEQHRGESYTQTTYPFETITWWQSVHTSVYDITNRALRVAVQETDDWYTFQVPVTAPKVDAYTKAETDAKLAEKIGGGEVPSFEQDPAVGLTNGTIHIKGQTITPLTSFTEQDPTATAKANAAIASSPIIANKADKSDIPDVSGFVPYTGATNRVDLGNNALSAYYIESAGVYGHSADLYFGTGKTSPVIGVMWDSTDRKDYLYIPSGDALRINDGVSGIETIDQRISRLAPHYTPSATDTTFSNAVLAVGLNIDTNSVAVLNEIAATFGGFPITGTATTVGGLLAALAAAVAWLRKNKIDKLKVTGMTAEATAENGVAKLDDFFKDTNSLLNARITYERNDTGLKDRAFNALTFDGTEYNLSTALAAVTPTASGQPRDLLIVATGTAATTISFTAGTIKGDKPTIDGAGTWLITLTEYAANTWYCRQIKMEDAA